MIVNFTKSDIINSYRYLHTIPEPEWNEFKTSRYIEEKLKEFGLSPVKCTKTGLFADIHGTQGDKTVLFRADIDALPILEETGLSFASENKGYMHACGHDFHTASLLYAAKLLNDNKDKLNGTVRVVFQPAEEGSGGALPMIDEGVLEGVTAAFAIHADPDEHTGTITFKNGGITASPDDFKIIIKGKGGHGAEPQKAINPITVAAKIIERYNNIKKTYFPDEMCVITICTVNGGTFNNIIPDTCEITGTARSFSPEIRSKLRSILEKCAVKTAEAYGAKADFTYNALFPPTVCDENTNKIAVEAGLNTEGINRIKELETGYMIGDDFSYYAECVPSSYIRFGTAGNGQKYPLHSSKFKIDEKALMISCKFLANIAAEYLK